MTQAELSLVERWVLHRDADAFSRIVAEHSAMVYSTCLRVLRSADDAEDVAQECFLALASGRVRVRVSLGGWLHTLATRRSLDRIRSNRRREQRERRSAEPEPQPQALPWNDVQEYVDQAIDRLPAKCQTVLVGHFLEGQSFDALAAKLDLPRSTVASRVQRAIELVRADLRKRGVPVQPSVLSAMLAAPVGQELPKGLALALGKMAIAGAGAAPGPAVAGGAAILTGGTILMAKKVVAVSIVGLALALAGFFYARESVDNDSMIGTGAVVDPQQAGAPGASAAEPGVGNNEKDSGGGASAEAGGTGSSKTQASDLPADAALAAAGGAEKDKDETAGAGADRSSISGYVMDDKGYVFSGAAVRAEIYDRISGVGRGDMVSTSTDSNGLYKIALKSSGYASVYASAKGYLMQTRIGLPVSPRADLTGINFTLVPGKFFVAGTVQDQDGRALEGAEVQLRREADVNSIYTLAYAISDKDGRFEIAVEREGSCDFSASKDGYGSGFFPDIRTGTEDAEFVLRSPGAISGSVTLANGNPVPGARVEIVGEALPMGESPSEGGQPMQLAPLTVFSDDQGQYRADGLGEGYQYLVQVKQAGAETASTMDANAPPVFQAIERIMGSASLAQQRWVKVTAGKTTSGINFVLQPRARIHGTASDTQSGLPAYHLLLEAYVGESTGLNATAAWTWTQPDGSYTLEIPLAAPTSVRIAGMYISSLGAPWNTDEMPLATVEGSPGADIELDLTPYAPCSANITVTDGAGGPVAGAVLMLTDAAGHGMSGGLEGTDENGRYALHGLPPDRQFTVSVASSAYGEAILRLAESSPFYGGLGDAVPEVPIVLAAEGGVEGVVVDPSGAPLPDLPIEVSATGNLPVPQQTTTTDADGWFTLIRGFPAGPYSEIAIRSSARGFIEQGIAGGAEVTADAVVNVGTVMLSPAPQNPQAPPRE